MKEGKNDYALPQKRPFRQPRFFYFHNHLGLDPNIFSVAYSGASVCITIICITGPTARSLFYKNLVSRSYEQTGVMRRKRHTAFVILDFIRNADDHLRPPGKALTFKFLP